MPMTEAAMATPHDEQTTLVRRKPTEPPLHVRTIVPTSPRALVLVVHGYGEHHGRHSLIIDTLVRQQLAIATFDFRGHGRSAGQRGHCQHFSEYLDDVDEVLLHARKKVWDVPLYAFGHSFGALVLATYALAHPQVFQGLALTSPFFAMALAVPWAKRFAGVVASKLRPGFTLPSEIPPHRLSHVTEVGALYQNDRWVHGVATARWYTETMAAQKDVLARAHQLTVPMLVVASGDDCVADVTVTRQVVARARGAEKTLEIRSDLFHEVLNEAEGPAIAERIARWIATKAG